jgi:putative glycosyltransferase (TIGR04372 family)
VVRFLINSILTLAIFIASLLEVPLFLVLNRSIFKNKIIYIFYHWSFGHEISGLDYAARLYYPHRISLIHILHTKSNPWLSTCFHHSMDVFYFKSLLPFYGGPEHRFLRIRYKLLRFFILAISSVFGNSDIISLEQVYRTVSLVKGRLWLEPSKFQNFPPPMDLTGYVGLLHSNFGQKPELPSSSKKRCQQEIIKRVPNFFSKPFVTLCLREKGRGEALETDYRNPGPHENYLEAVAYLIKQGYFVVGTGETNHKVFNHLDGYFSFSDVDVPYKLMNIFLLTESALFIGQLSGPFQLPNSCGIPSLLCDSMPHRYGTFKQSDLVLFKNIRDKNTGSFLSLVDIYRTFPELAMGYGYQEKNVEIVSNTPDEILDAVKETVKICRGELVLSQEDIQLCENFQKLYAPEMYIYYQRNRPPMSLLRRNRDALLNIL